MKPEILYYNNFIVPEIIKNKNPLIEPFLSDKFSFELFDTYEKFGLNKFNVVYDRSDSIPHYLNIAKDACPLPQPIENYNKSFFELTKARCEELLSQNKYVNVMWSGGLDSTYILFMLRHFANDKKQVRIYGTYNSIIESGDLFDRRLKHEFDYDIHVSCRNDFNYNSDDSIFVSGQCGNQLFGPTDDMFATGATAMFHHTLGTPSTIYEKIDGNVDEELLEFLQPMIATSPKKLETVCDLRWYCIFNLDWYTAVFSDKILLEKERAHKVYSFFDTMGFQEWAVNTKEPFTKIKGNSKTHRWQMRQVLDELFGEKEYAWNKPKKISTFCINQPEWLFMLRDFHNIVNG